MIHALKRDFQDIWSGFDIFIKQNSHDDSILIPGLIILFFILKGFFKNLFILFIYFWLRWVLVAACRLSLFAVSGGYSLLWCTDFLLQWLLLLWSTGSRRTGFSSCGSRTLEHRLSSCGTQA